MAGSPLDATGVLHITAQIMEAKSHRERAGILLRVPDIILPNYGGEIIVACVSSGFASGEGFIQSRVSAMSATRDEHGLMPAPVAMELERWRNSFSRYAAGGEEPPAQ